MPYFFNGRLWISPATMSNVDDSAMANKNLSVGNVVALIGTSTGGQPNKPLTFGDPTTAKNVLKSGELLTAVQKAFSPSTEVGGPASVVVIRVNPATQSALTLLDASAAPSIVLTSADWGAWTKQIKIKLQAGSTKGFQATSQYGNSYYTQDNISRDAFSVQYTGGGASATMSITGTSVILSSPAGTPVSTIDLTQMKTIQQLVDAIDTVPNFTALVLDGNGTKPALNGLDYVNAVDVKATAYTATANLQALVDWFNSTAQGYVTAARAANAGNVPALIPFTYLTGGSDGVTTNQQWSDAFSALQAADVQWVTPVTSDPSIAAMTDAHVQFMSTTGRKERRSVCGTATGTSDAAAIAAAKAINSDRTSLTHLGFYDYDDNGDLVLFPPYILAAMIAGAFSGVNPGTPMTNKSLSVRGLERDLVNPTDTDPLITGGVLCVENTSSGFKVVKSISTWLTNDNYNRVEQSVGAALDFTVRNVRNALDVLRGQKATPENMARAVSIADSTLRLLAGPEPTGPGVLVGDQANPAYKNIQAVLDGDVIGVSFQCSPVLPINYIPVSVYAVPYSGSASA